MLPLTLKAVLCSVIRRIEEDMECVNNRIGGCPVVIKEPIQRIIKLYTKANELCNGRYLNYLIYSISNSFKL